MLPQKGTGETPVSSFSGCSLLADSVQEATALFKGNIYLAQEEK